MCKFALVGFCPYEEFLNTKSDIGPCPCRYHDESLKEQFELKGDSYYREEYERVFYAFLEGLVNDLERRFKRGKERLEVRPNENSISINDENEEKRILLDLQMKELLTKIEACGEEGRIREAQELSSQVDALKVEMDQLQGAVDLENPLHKLEKRMEVCTTCGAFLIVNDAPKRVEAHFEGRQHSGWVRVRESVELLRQKWSGYNQRRGSSTSSNKDSYSDSRDQRRDYRDDRDRRVRDDRERSRGDYERERSRDYERDRSRDYERDSKSRDYERDRDHHYRNSSSSSNGYKERDRRDSSSRDSRNDSRVLQYDNSNSIDRRDSSRKSSHSASRPTRDEVATDNYVPGAGLDYELGEIVEEGEIEIEESSTKRSRDHCERF